MDYIKAERGWIVEGLWHKYGKGYRIFWEKIFRSLHERVIDLIKVVWISELLGLVLDKVFIESTDHRKGKK